MIIRSAVIEDAGEIKALHDRSVLALCRKDYTPEQLEDWVNYSDVGRYEERLKQHRSFVAEIDGRMVGYVRWNPATNELCSIFVHPDFARQGIATRLMENAYQDMAALGVDESWLMSSLTAVPFYEAEGWQIISREMRGPLACVKMEKYLV